MFCPHCGSSAQDHHAYCHGCGAAMPASRTWPVPPRPADPLSLVGDQGIRLLAYGAAGLLGVLLVSAVLKAVFALALPLLLVLAVVYWARQRRRGYY